MNPWPGLASNHLFSNYDLKRAKKNHCRLLPQTKGQRFHVFQFADLLILRNTKSVEANQSKLTEYHSSDLVCLLRFQLKLPARSFVILSLRES